MLQGKHINKDKLNHFDKMLYIINYLSADSDAKSQIIVYIYNK